MYIQVSVHSGRYNFKQVFIQADVVSGKCSFWQVSFLTNVNSGKRTFREMFFWQIIFEEIFFSEVLGLPAHHRCVINQQLKSLESRMGSNAVASANEARGHQPKVGSTKICLYKLILCWQRGRMGKGVVFTTTLIEWSGFNPHPGQVVASLDKTLYDDYLCLVASNKQQIQWTRIGRNPQEHWIIRNS